VTTLVRPLTSVFWELRRAWASGKRVSLSLDDRCEIPRIEGRVTEVAATDAFVKVNGRHVSGETILAVHWPSLLGDSDARPARNMNFAPRWRPQQEQLPGVSA
jgi:hypothetical protein